MADQHAPTATVDLQHPPTTEFLGDDWSVFLDEFAAEIQGPPSPPPPPSPPSSSNEASLEQPDDITDDIPVVLEDLLTQSSVNVAQWTSSSHS